MTQREQITKLTEEVAELRRQVSTLSVLIAEMATRQRDVVVIPSAPAPRLPAPRWPQYPRSPIPPTICQTTQGVQDTRMMNL